MSWPNIKLGDACTFVRGPFGGALKKEFFVDDGFSVYEQQHAIYKQFDDVRYFVGERKFKELKRFELNPGDLIMSCSGTMGKIAVVPQGIRRGVINQALLKLTPKRNVNLDYLKYWLESETFQFMLNGNTHGAAIKNVASVATLKEMSIPLPPLPEQKRIAAILDKADAIRRKRQQAIQLADDFLRAVFLDMFGDPVTNPKGWEMRKWCNVLKIVNGKNQKAVEDEAGAYPICGSGGFMAKANNWLTEANSVIIGRKGNINSPILMRERFWNVDTAFGLEPKREALSHNYLFWFCKFFDFEQLNKAVTIPSLTKTDLLQIDIPLPSRDVQGNFDEVVERIDMLSAKNEKTLSEQLFESLSQKAFSGQL